MTYSVIHSISTGPLKQVVRDALAADPEDYRSDVLVTEALQEKKQPRMVTIRDDGGPDDTVFSMRRHGVNVWAENKVTAQMICFYVMAVLRSHSSELIPVIDQLSGPGRIPDNPPMVVDGVELEHYYFTFRARLRGTNF